MSHDFLIPVRCYSCGKVLAGEHIGRKYTRLLRANISEEDALLAVVLGAGLDEVYGKIFGVNWDRYHQLLAENLKHVSILRILDIKDLRECCRMILMGLTEIPVGVSEFNPDDFELQDLTFREQQRLLLADTSRSEHLSCSVYRHDQLIARRGQVLASDRLSEEGGAGESEPELSEDLREDIQRDVRNMLHSGPGVLGGVQIRSERGFYLAR